MLAYDDSFLAWLAEHPTVLAKAMVLVDPDVEHKPWKLLTLFGLLSVCPETWQDLAIAYFDGDEAALRRAHNDMIAAATATPTLPAILHVASLDFAMARSAGRRG
jgi:hypothetical protein